MKKIAVSAFLLILVQSVAWGQFSNGGPLFSFSSFTTDNANCGNNNETFCISVRVEDFTDLTSVKFPIVWDPTVIEFVEVQSFNPLMIGLDASDFDASRADEGLLLLNWIYQDCETASDAITLDDDQVIFQICFRPLGAYGQGTNVEIVNDDILTNDPEPIVVKRLNVCFASIGLRLNPGFVSTCVRPLTLFTTSTEGNQGDLVCVDVKVKGFDDLTSLQFSVNWDTDVLVFDNVNPLEALPNLSLSSFGTPAQANVGPGRLTMSWTYINPDDPGISLPDSTSIFQLCFRIVGDCETSSNIRFSDNPTTIEVTNTVEEGFLLPTLNQEGSVQVGPCDPTGLQLFANCGDSVSINDEICVQISALHPVDISFMNYLMEWNPNILKFKSITNLNTTAVPGLTQGNFNRDNVSNGILGINWTSPSANATADFSATPVIYEICFDVVGLGGNSPFNFIRSQSRVNQVGSIQNIGIFPSNCAVLVRQPEGVRLNISDAQGPPDANVCVDVTTENFEEVIDLQFSLTWDTRHIEFTEIKDLNPLFTAGDINTLAAPGGTLTLDWASATGQTLADGDPLFSICYNVVGTPPGELGQQENCDLISFVDFPIEGQAVTSNSNGNNIGLVDQPGEVCVLNPEGFFLVIGDTTSFIGDTVCIPFKVGEFEDITSAQFTVNWDPGAIAFVEVRNPNADLGLVVGNNDDISTASAEVGVLAFDWAELAGRTLPDSAVLFEVCFAVVGDVNTCTDIEINNEPNPSVTTINGAGSVFPIGGGVCIEDRLVIVDSLITPVTCPGGRDGSIELTVTGGQGPIFFNWSSVPPQFNARAVNLPVGRVAVTIFDSSTPALVTRDTFNIPLIDELPEANAGPNKVLGCNPNFVLLTGSGSTGPEYSYRWTTNNGQLPGDIDELNVLAGSAGTYVLQVTNTNTGCTVYDTTIVTQPDYPVANAGTDRVFDCSVDSLQLNGSGSTQGDTVAYLWTAFDGGVIRNGEETSVNPTILTGGLYALKVTFAATGCAATDTVEIRDVTDPPNANAGLDQTIGCEGDSVILSGNLSDNLQDVSYQWLNAEGEVISNSINAVADTLGDFILIVTDIVTQCKGRDTVTLLPNAEFPDVNAGPDLALDCINPTIELGAVISNTDSFSVQWTAIAGGMIEEDTDTLLNALAVSEGTYIIRVINDANRCASTDTLEVINNIRIPNIDVGMGGTITCQEPAVILSGVGPVSMDSLRFTWTLGGLTVATDTLDVEVTEPGVYYLEVLNLSNGCSNQDSVEVENSAELPVVAITPGPNNGNYSLDCRSNQVALAAEILPEEANYTIVWDIVGDGGNLVSGINSLNPVVDAAGVYRIQVTNQETGCTGENQIVVDADTLAPDAVAGMDLVLTCAVDTVVLNGIGSEAGSFISYSWSVLEGSGQPTPTDVTQPKVTAPGLFQITVLDSLTGCVATDTVRVRIDTLAPQVAVATPDPLTCEMPEVQLDGTGSDQSGNLDAAWSGLEGQTVNATADPFVALVNAGGSFRLVVTNLDNGCLDSATVEVVQNSAPPVADAGATVTIECPGIPVQLNGANSDSGDSITYEWTVLEGAATLENGSTATPTVDQPGTFELRVINTNNGCTSTASVSAVKDERLVDAEAGPDINTCFDYALLDAVQPGTASGQWSTTAGATLENPTLFNSMVEDLPGGDNVFVWTLSLDDCPNYSSDSVVVRREVAPVANNDLLQLTMGQTEVAINVKSNDIQNTTLGTSISIIDQPSIGVIDSVAAEAGVVNYRVFGTISGEDEFSYRICNDFCAEVEFVTLCDTAFVKVDVPFDPSIPQPDLINGITPNGDGMNDALRFELLDNNPERFEDNEIIIFNRWGDVVYQAKPYLNDWQGNNSSGELLPDGTYYFILRLDISEGLIFKGDVTILR